MRTALALLATISLASAATIQAGNLFNITDVVYIDYDINYDAYWGTGYEGGQQQFLSNLFHRERYFLKATCYAQAKISIKLFDVYKLSVTGIIEPITLSGELPSCRGKQGHIYGPGAGFCLEPQQFPDAPNQPNFPSTVVPCGETRRGTVEYRFSAGSALQAAPNRTQIGNAAVRRGRWKLVREYPRPWELYDMDTDRAETRDLASVHPDTVQELAKAWQVWADRVGVVPWDQVLAGYRSLGKSEEEAAG